MLRLTLSVSRAGVGNISLRGKEKKLPILLSTAARSPCICIHLARRPVIVPMCEAPNSRLRDDAQPGGQPRDGHIDTAPETAPSLANIFV